MTAREKFQIGQRVQMTDVGRKQHPLELADPGGDVGVVAVLRDDFPDWVSVDKDAGFRVFDHMSFWEPAK